jgi:tRNA1(Val) A37 N6-methylase TrmN6
MFLYQPGSGYRYNSDSIFLYDFIHTHSPKGKLLDVGCGVGILSLLCARDFDVDVTVSDKQERALAYARHNFSINGSMPERVVGDFLDADFETKFDFVISNPPFYHSDVLKSRDESIHISRYAEHLPFSHFAEKVSKILAPRGYFIFCYDASQVDMLFQTLREYRLNPEKVRFIHSKAQRVAKTVMISARKGSRSMCTVLPPLIVFDDDGEYAPEAMKAFERASTHSIKADMEMDFKGEKGD